MRRLEHLHQCATVKWFKWAYPDMDGLLYAIPNGGKRGIAEAKRLKAEGVVAGMPDLHLAYPTAQHPGLYIEMKTSIGTVSPRQKVIMSKLTEVGYRTQVCRSFDEAKAVIEGYLLGCPSWPTC